MVILCAYTSLWVAWSVHLECGLDARATLCMRFKEVMPQLLNQVKLVWHFRYILSYSHKALSSRLANSKEKTGHVLKFAVLQLCLILEQLRKKTSWQNWSKMDFCQICNFFIIDLIHIISDIHWKRWSSKPKPNRVINVSSGMSSWGGVFTLFGSVTTISIPVLIIVAVALSWQQLACSLLTPVPNLSLVPACSLGLLSAFPPKGHADQEASSTC